MFKIVIDRKIFAMLPLVAALLIALQSCSSLEGLKDQYIDGGVAQRQREKEQREAADEERRFNAHQDKVEGEIAEAERFASENKVAEPYIVEGEVDSRVSNLESRSKELQQPSSRHPQPNARAQALVARSERCITALKEKSVKNRKEYQIKQAIAGWTEIQEMAEGWESKVRPVSYAQFAKAEYIIDALMNDRDISLLLLSAISRWLSSEQLKTALKSNAEEPRLTSAKHDAEVLTMAIKDRLCDIADDLAKAGEMDVEAEEVSKFQALAKDLNQKCAGSNKLESVVKHISSVIEVRNARASAKEKAKEEMVKKLTEAADSSWPKFVQQYTDIVKLDPVECLQNIGPWKQKRVDLTCGSNLWNRQYRASEYGYITTYNGVPLKLSFDQSIARAFKELQKSSGVAMALEGGNEVIAVVEGQCLLEQGENKMVLKPTGHYELEWVTVAVQVPALALRIIAVKGSTFALDVRMGCSASGVSGIPEIVVK